MKIKLITEVSGTRDGVPWPPRGSVVDLPDDEAAQYCAAGIATPVADTDQAETATAPDPEQRDSDTTDSGTTDGAADATTDGTDGGALTTANGPAKRTRGNAQSGS